MAETVPFDCPRCGIALAMSDRQGIEIDYCPQCRGVWLDRGELDKIIDRSEVAQATPVAQPTSGSPAGGWTQPAAPPSQQPWGGGQHGQNQGHGYGQGGKKKSWLGELFD
jgi:Zn-finger nucleic acid-binding protein